MNDQEKKRLLGILAGAAEVYGRELSEVAIRLYLAALVDLPFKDVSAAFSDLVKGSKWFPKPAEIRELVLGAPIPVEDEAHIEVAKAITAAREVGSNRNVVFDNETTQAVVMQAFGGWVDFCDSANGESEKWLRKDFIKTYIAYRHGGVSAHGICYGRTHQVNQHNRSWAEHAIAYDEGEPVFIGDKDAAKRVLEYKQKEEYAENKVNIKKLLKLAQTLGDHSE